MSKKVWALFVAFLVETVFLTLIGLLAYHETVHYIYLKEDNISVREICFLGVNKIDNETMLIGWVTPNTDYNTTKHIAWDCRWHPLDECSETEDYYNMTKVVGSR